MTTRISDVPFSNVAASTQLGVYNVKNYGAKGDGVTDDTSAIQSAVAAVLDVGGGEVFFPQGTYYVTSSARTDATVTYSAGTWTDSSITANDVGSYVIGSNINAAKVPKITAVTPGVSFTTDVAPTGSISAQSITIVNPAILLSAGITLQGVGGTFAQSDDSRTTAVSKIVDHGTGVTILIRGGAGSSTQAIRYTLNDISIQGNANSTLYGMYIGNFSWFSTARNCDFSHHGTAAIVADGNINSNSFYDCTIRANGKAGASGVTGGVLTHPYYLQPSSSFNFFNCYFEDNYGWGVADPIATGACGIGLFMCQFNSTLATNATGSGTSMALTDHANGADSKAVVVGGWSESADLYDADCYGSPTIINFTFAGAAVTNHLRAKGGVTQVIGCRFENASSVGSVAFQSGGNLSWMGCTCNDSFFYSGCGFSNANIPAVGMSTGAIAITSGVMLRQGSGVPATGLGTTGDMYFRTDGGGAASSNIYLKTGSSTWTGIA